jgi:hypothetical protein
MTSGIREYIKVIDDLGLRVINTSVTGSNHYKITVTSRGKRKFFVASRSPSDHKTIRNFREMVKRWQRSLQERT